MISVHDIGVVATAVFEKPEKYLGEDIDIAADNLTGPEMADTLGRVTGIPTRFEPVQIEYLRAFDEEVAKMFEWLNTRDLEPFDTGLVRGLSSELMNFETWLRWTGWKPGP